MARLLTIVFLVALAAAVDAKAGRWWWAAGTQHGDGISATKPRGAWAPLPRPPASLTPTLQLDMWLPKSGQEALNASAKVSAAASAVSYEVAALRAAKRKVLLPEALAVAANSTAAALESWSDEEGLEAAHLALGCATKGGPCVPGPAQYSNAPAAAATLNYETTVWISCQGPFALCFLAQCGGVIPGSKPRQAGCGCIDGATTGVQPLGLSEIQPSYVLSAKAAAANSLACYGGQNPAVAGMQGDVPTPCAAPPKGTTNAAPICQAMAAGTLYGPHWPLVSTFQSAPTQGIITCSGAGDGQSAYGNCMTAACERRPGPGGTALTCYCPVIVVAPGAPYRLAYDLTAYPNAPPPGLCNASRLDGTVLSGAPLVVTG